MKLFHLETVIFRLCVLSPVHIGDGKVASAGDYLYDPGSGALGVLDMDGLLTYIVERKLMAQYEQFMTGPGPKDLAQWARANGILPAIQRQFVRYTLMVDAGARRFNARDLHFFIKDSDGRPYLPGSSIKGALRTAIAWSLVKPDQSARLQGMARLDKPKFAARQVEAALFNTLGHNVDKPGDMVNDIMRGVRVSDTVPLPFETLTVCRKLDRARDGSQTLIPILRECLRPGTEVPVKITFDFSELRGTGLGSQRLLQVLKDHYAGLQAGFDSMFAPLSEDADVPVWDACLYLGGGTGYPSKTITARLYGPQALDLTSRILKNNFPAHHHERDAETGVSPRRSKRTAFRGKYHKMGLCRLLMEEGGDEHAPGI